MTVVSAHQKPAAGHYRHTRAKVEAPAGGSDCTARPSLLEEILASLVAAFPVTPVLAALITVAASAAAYIALPEAPALRAHPMIALPLNLLLTWLALSLPCFLLGLTRAERVNFSSFSDIRTQLGTLEASCGSDEASSVADCTGRARDDLARCRVQAELNGHVTAIRDALCTKGPQWVLGVGYLSLWRRLHRAEALLPYLESSGSLRARADQLHLRVTDSPISGTAVDHVDETLKALENSDDTTDGNSAEPTGSTHGTGRSATWAARAAISQTQLAIDEFRDARYAQLVSARNHLATTSAVTGMALYALLWLAFVVAVDVRTISAAQPSTSLARWSACSPCCIASQEQAQRSTIMA